MKQIFNKSKWWFSPLALVLSLSAAAQSGEGYYGDVRNTGTVSHGVGTGAQAFSIFTGGSYNGFANGTSADNFIGPNGAAGALEIAGVIAPIFDTVKFNNGVNLVQISNTAGIVVNGSVLYNNGITTTVRTNRTAGLAGAIQFTAPAIYTPALTPAAGTDAVFTDGYVSKVNPSSFVYPVGNVTDLRPITATGTGTFTTAWNNSNVASFYTGTLPTGTTALATNGFWEWNGTAASTAIVSIPDVSTLTSTASQVSVMAYDGTAWTNIGGVFSAVTENSSNAAVVNVPSTTQALAIGNSVPYVMVKTKAFLQGATASGVMSTSLNSLGLLPPGQPYNIAPFGSAGTGYAGTESVAAGFFAAHGNIVDWVLVELRDATFATVATRAAFLTSSGAIVDIDGTSDVSFLGAVAGTAVGIPSTSYYIAVRHRNHLGIRTAGMQALTTTATLFDFSLASTNANGNNAMKNLGNGVFAMWAGNVNGDTKIVFASTSSDVSVIVSGVANRAGNNNNSSNFNGYYPVYSVLDVNMDGRVLNNALPSDKSIIITSVITNPGNTNGAPNSNALVERLP